MRVCVCFLSFVFIVVILDGGQADNQLLDAQRGSNVTFVTAVSGVSVDLRCKVRLRECGNFHGIEWYREKTVKDLSSSPSAYERVYVYRHNSGRGKAENAWQNRATHVYEARRRQMVVSVSPTRLLDEALYRCEITYENLEDRWFDQNCEAAQMTRLTLLERPQFVRIELKNGSEVSRHHDTVPTIGPYNEGSVLVLRCRAGGGKPIPQVGIDFKTRMDGWMYT